MKEFSYKWRMLGLLTLSYFLMQGARQVFNVSLPDVKAALPGASDAQWGLVRTVFLVAYGLFVPLAGIAADVFRRKWVLGPSVHASLAASGEDRQEGVHPVLRRG